MYKLDVKVTVWERVEFDSEEQMKDVLSKLKSGELETSNDVCEYLDKGVSYVDDTSEEMRISDNNGCATMEILDEDGNSIWNNEDGDIDNDADKYICGSCGIHVDKVTFNEDRDIDECENCKD